MSRNYNTRRNPRRNSSRSSNRNRRNAGPETGSPVAVLLLIVIILGGAYILKGEEMLGYGKDIWQRVQGIQKEEVTQPAPVYAMPCMEANAAKIIAYTLLDGSTLVDEAGDEWYSKYYRAIEKDGRFKFFNIENALKPVTYDQTSVILSDVLGDAYGVKLDTNEETRNKNISFEKFLEMYHQALSQANEGVGLTYEEISIVSTPATNKSLEAWQVSTDKGRYGFEGLIVDPFKDYTIKVAVKDDEILGIVETISSYSILEQCYISDVTEELVTIKIGEEKVVYKNQSLDTSNKGLLGTVTIKEGTVVGFELEEQKSTDRILRVTDEYIELEKGGRYTYDKVEVYDTTPEGKIQSLAQVPSGVEVECVIKDNEVEAIQIMSKDFKDNMRVVVSQDGLGDYSHEDVVLKSGGEYDILYKDKKLVFQKGGSWSAKTFDWQEEVDKVTFIPKENAQMEIESIKRQGKSPKYQGNIEVYKEADGSFVIVNETDMTNYLAGVIPSEMPTSYGIEAAKVQAIAARSYAITHRTNSKFMKYGAQVDDTTSTQVYNNVPADEISYQAAKETADRVLKHEDKVISGNFFSTSAGYTANYGEVWATGEIFPTDTPDYLVSRQQYLGDREVGDMREEKDAYTFFTTPADQIDAFDNEAAWFRWQVHFTAEELAHVVNSNVYKLTTQYPSLVKILVDDEWQSGELETLGNIENIKVRERGEGGNIMELSVVGDKGTIKVSTEYLVRCLFAPIQKDSEKEPIKIIRANGTEVENMNMLPSAFFSMDMTYDDKQMVKEVTFYGGGFGHGVGMSQEGVKGMVERGYTYKQVLEHYYQNVEIVSYKEEAVDWK